MNIAWVIDSAACIDPEFARARNIHVIPMQVVFAGKSYSDMVDITEEEFYERLDQGMVPTSSQPPLGAFIRLYQRLQTEGYDAVISIHTSGGLSGTVNTARVAAQSVDLPVEVFDSGLVTKPMMYVLQEGLSLYSANPGLTLAEIIAGLSAIRDNAVAYFIINDLGYLHRGGRLKTTAALMGSILQVKPIVQVKNQSLDIVAKVRTARKAKEYLYAQLDNDASHGDIRIISVVHANHLQEARIWSRELNEKFRATPVDVSPLGTSLGVHSGPKAIGLCWLCG